MPKDVDWTQIKAEWLAGQVSLRQLARNHGVSARAIDKRAEKEGWPDRRPVVRRRSAPKNRRSAQTASADQGDTADLLVPQPLIVSDLALVHPLERVFDLLDRQRARSQMVLGSLDVLLAGLAQMQRRRLDLQEAGEDIPPPMLSGMMLAEAELLKKASDIMRVLHVEQRRLFGLAEDLPNEVDRLSPDQLQRLRHALRRALYEVSGGS
jgi:hypothetical protein